MSRIRSIWRVLGVIAWLVVLCAPMIGGLAGLAVFPIDVDSAHRWFGGGLVAPPVAAFVAGLAFGLPPHWREGVIAGSLGAFGVIAALVWAWSVVILGATLRDINATEACQQAGFAWPSTSSWSWLPPGLSCADVDHTLIITTGPWGSMVFMMLALVVVLGVLAASVVFAVRAVRR